MRRNFIYAIHIKRVMWIFFVLVLCITNVAAAASVQKAVIPVVKSYAKGLANKYTVTLVNSSVSKILEQENVTYKGLYNIQRSEAGEVQSIEINAPYVNLLKTKITSEINSEFEQEKKINIPIGNVFKNIIFLGYGPKIPIRLTGHGYTSADIKSEFSSAGINQTVHKVFITVKTNVSVILPYEIVGIDVETTVPVTETVIVGGVPNLVH